MLLLNIVSHPVISVVEHIFYSGIYRCNFDYSPTVTRRTSGSCG